MSDAARPWVKRANAMALGWSETPPDVSGYYWAALPLTADIEESALEYRAPQIVKVTTGPREGFLGFHMFYRQKVIGRRSLLARSVLWGDRIADVALTDEDRKYEDRK